jgi:UDP-N-acetyl-D-glucosamine dehydrogenase
LAQNQEALEKTAAHFSGMRQESIMSDLLAPFVRRIQNRQTRIGIIGLGYVGLPLARAFVERGFSVLGFDTDAAKIAQLRRRQSYIGHIPHATVSALVDRGFEATDCFDRLGEADAILICVPTPLTPARTPELSFVANSGRAISACLRPGQLVVLESTSYPGTTRQVLQPLLEAGGLQAGRDFFLAYSPEREDPGIPEHTASKIPKVVGGFDGGSLEAAAALYCQVVAEVVHVSSLEIAEACKILENTYRAVNIALVNELKVLFGKMGIDVWEVIAAARTKPFGFQPFYPGPGLGGHCIPVDPFYLTWVARTYGLSTRLIELAGEINTAMPSYVVAKVCDALNERGKAIKGSKVLLLGMAYKKDVDDSRESPGFELMDQLLRKGALVRYNDPHIPRLPRTRRYPHLVGESQMLSEKLLATQDCVLIVTDHSDFDWKWLVAHAPLVVDTRNATMNVGEHRERIVRA